MSYKYQILGDVSRRDVMKVAGAGLLAVSLVPAKSANSQEAQPLVVALESIGNPVYSPGTLDTVAKDIATGTFAEGLLRRGSGGSLEPMLAESYEVSADGRTITFKLRKGIKFHDGSDFTSEDVKYTLEAIVAKDSLNFDAGLWRRSLERVEVVDDHTVTLHLREQNIGLLYRMAVPFNGQVILSKKNETNPIGSAIGTGPWKMVEFRPGELIRFEAVPNHWRQTPTFKELIVRQVPEESTRRSMVVAGQADLAPVTPASGPGLKAGGAQVFADPRSYVLAVSPLGLVLPSRATFKRNVPWVADPADKPAWERALKVRKAMDMAIDRQTICDTLLSGEAVPAADRTTNEAWKKWNPAWKPTSYDPDKAKQLLTEAGFPDGFEFPMMLFEENDRPGLTVIGQAVAQYWQAIGLRPKLANVDYSTQIRPATRDRKLGGTVIVKANPAYEEPVLGYIGAFWSKAESILYAEYEPLDALIEEALATSDMDRRTDIEVQMVDLVFRNHFLFPIAWVNGLWGASPRITQFPRIAGVFGLYNLEFAA